MARRRVDLAEFLLCDRNRPKRAIEQDGAARGRALIDREEKVRHELMLQILRRCIKSHVNESRQHR
jgi:hypothetical protein